MKPQVLHVLFDDSLGDGIIILVAQKVPQGSRPQMPLRGQKQEFWWRLNPEDPLEQF